MNILTKILFKITKPTLVLLGGEERVLALKALCHILGFNQETTLKQLFLKKIVILPLEKRPVFLRGSIKIILGIGIEPEPLLKELYDLGGLLRSHDLIIYASESKKAKKTAFASKAQKLSFGIKAGDNFSVSGVKRDKDNTSFKVSVEGNTVPIWLNNDWNKSEIHATLLAIFTCLKLGSNLVHASQALKNFEK